MSHETEATITRLRLTGLAICAFVFCGVYAFAPLVQAAFAAFATSTVWVAVTNKIEKKDHIAFWPIVATASAALAFFVWQHGQFTFLAMGGVGLLLYWFLKIL